MSKNKVNIEIATKGLKGVQAGLTKTDKKLGKLKKTGAAVGSTLGKLRKSFLGLKAGIALAAGVAGLGLLIRQSLKANDELAKISANIGVSTEALAAFRLQGQLAGVSTETINSSLKRLVKRLGEAAQGTGAAKKQLELMGINIQELARMHPEDAFALIADSISEMDTQTAKVAATAAFFGREGIDMIGMLEGGSEAFKAAARDTKLFGTAINKVDAKKIEDYNDEMTRLQELMRGIATRVTVQFAESFKPLIDKFVESARETEGFKDKVNSLVSAMITLAAITEAGIKITIKGGGLIANEVKEAKDSLKLITDPVNIVLNQLTLDAFIKDFEYLKSKITGETLTPGEKGSRKGLAGAEPHRAGFVDAKAMAAALAEEQKTGIVEITKEMQQEADKWTDIVKTPFEQMQDQFFEIQELSKAGLIDETTFKRSMDRISADFLATKDNMESEAAAFAQERSRLDLSTKDFAILQYNQEFEQYRILVEQGKISAQEFERIRIEGEKRVAEQFKGQMSSMERNYRDGINRMKGPLTDFFLNMDQGWANTQNLATNVMATIKRKLAELAADRALKFITNSLFGAATGGGGGGFLSSIFGKRPHGGGLVGSLPTQKIATLPTFHKGGLSDDEVLAKILKTEFVVSPEGTKAAGKERLNRINRGDLSDFKNEGSEVSTENVRIFDRGMANIQALVLNAINRNAGRDNGDAPPVQRVAFSPRINIAVPAKEDVQEVFRRNQGIPGGSVREQRANTNRGNQAGGGGGSITVLAPVTIQVQAIDTQSGVAFVSKPENLEVLESHIRQVIIGNGGKNLGL